MKLSFYSIFIISIIICFSSCSNSEKTEGEASSELEYSEEEEVEKTKTFTFTNSHIPVLKEQVFFFLRKQVLDLDENTFIKFEELALNGKQFKYKAVVIEKELLNQYSVNNNGGSSIFRFASYTQDNQSLNWGDSITVIGSYEVAQTNQNSSEQPLSEVNIKIELEIHSSSLSASPYAYNGYERVIDNFNVSKDLVVKLNQPRIYSNKELYLKARIQELTKEDLSGLPSSDLAYLRNEIFARHGHTFKTDKMKSYFNNKDWYGAYYEDATPFLNEIEKKNANFIKSLES